MYVPPFAAANGAIELPPLNAALLRREGVGKDESHVRSREYSPGPLSGVGGSRGASSSPMVHHHSLPPTSSFFLPHGNGLVTHQLHPNHVLTLRGPSPLSPDAHWHPNQTVNAPTQLIVPVAANRTTSSGSTLSRTPPPAAVDGPSHIHPPVYSNHVAPSASMPTVGELERHYAELRQERKRLEEMLCRTDRLMLGLKRGIDEMRSGAPTLLEVTRGTSASPNPASAPSTVKVGPTSRPTSASGGSIKAGGVAPSSPPAVPAAVPLPRSDRQKKGEKIWEANEEHS